MVAAVAAVAAVADRAVVAPAAGTEEALFV